MDGSLVVQHEHIPGMGKEALALVYEFEKRALALPQLGIPTEHLLHAGMYARTIYMPKDTLVTGALIKIPTVVTMTGNTVWYVGEDKPVHRIGYHVIPASAGRKQVVVAIEDSQITMVFACDAKTVEEAEKHFTDEYDLLGSHNDYVSNRVLITGEK